MELNKQFTNTLNPTDASASPCKTETSSLTCGAKSESLAGVGGVATTADVDGSVGEQDFSKLMAAAGITNR